MKLTFITDTHGKHKKLTPFIKGGDAIFHTGDLTEMGYMTEIELFLEWYSGLDYEYKIFIAGNHDFGFMDYPKDIKKLLLKYPDITYLEDDFIYIGDYPNILKVYGTPWQPMFYQWAFNLDTKDLIDKLNNIHMDTDILLTHNPPFGILDANIGCPYLLDKVEQINPKIHAFGHAHAVRGIKKINDTTFINATILNQKYIFTRYPINIEYDFEKNKIKKIP